jgi:hypothetical protein
MLNGFIGGLLVAWILSWFGVDNMVIRSVAEIFKVGMSVSTYYISFGIIGLIGGAFGK